MVANGDDPQGRVSFGRDFRKGDCPIGPLGDVQACFLVTFVGMRKGSAVTGTSLCVRCAWLLCGSFAEPRRKSSPLLYE
jgi:hypothetical protein